MVLEKIRALMQGSKPANMKEAVIEALESGVLAEDILEQGLMAGMTEIGDKFERDEVFVPEVMVAARCMTAGIEVLKPHLAARPEQQRGKVVIGTVKGDLHDIGKNLVKIMLESKGLEVMDLGVNVTAEQYWQAAEQTGADLICLSALLTTSLAEMRRVVELVRHKDDERRVKVMVGGAPVTQGFCEQIGADSYAPNATAAANAAWALIAGS